MRVAAALGGREFEAGTAGCTSYSFHRLHELGPNAPAAVALSDHHRCDSGQESISVEQGHKMERHEAHRPIRNHCQKHPVRGDRQVREPLLDGCDRRGIPKLS